MRGSVAERIWPNDGLVKITVGSRRFTRFGTLNASARNSTYCFSRTWKARVSPISIRTVFGPRTFQGPLVLFVPDGSWINGAGLRHEDGLGVAALGLAST